MNEFLAPLLSYVLLYRYFAVGVIVYVSAVALPAVKYVIRSLTMPEAQSLAEQALRCGTAGEAVVLLEAFIRSAAPDLVELVKPEKSTQ